MVRGRFVLSQQRINNLVAIQRRYNGARTLLIGAQGLPLEVALATPASALFSV